MSQELLINVTPRETRVALLGNGVLLEVHIERSSKRGLVGNVYKGKVARVLPGMQAAFVDIGFDRAGFLHVSDIVPSAKNGNESVPEPNIADILHEGQSLLVQVLKDPIGTKGARLTTHLTIPSRYLVLLPNSENIAVSARIEEEAERERLLACMNDFIESDEKYGFIVRTAAESVKKELLEEDSIFLKKLMGSISERAKDAKPGTLVHVDLPLFLRTLRDSGGSQVERTRIDSRDTYKMVQVFCEQFLPDMLPGLEYYTGERPIFDLYGVEDEIQKALERKVQLKSGGYLIIDQTEAMTTIDVNTGAYVGSRNLEETIFKTNLEAAQTIARQLRLRNLGGIIILDFIDMMEEEHKQQVLNMLEKSLEQDHAKTNLSEVSSLGLVQMTRKRTKESLEHVLCETCSTCGGKGFLKTADTVCYEIFREVIRLSRQFQTESFLILSSQDVVDRLLDEESSSVAELEAFTGKHLRFQAEITYTQEQYDVVPV